MNMIKNGLIGLITVLCLVGCEDKENRLTQSSMPYYTTVFQCGVKVSKTGWCFATPSKIYTVDYQFVGKGIVQDYLISNGLLCVANVGSCASVYVDVNERL